MSRADVIVLHEGVSVADVKQALRRSGLTVSNGAFDTLFVISRAPPRFTDPNVIDLAAEMPALLRRQAGPERDIAGIDFFNGDSGDAA